MSEPRAQRQRSHRRTKASARKTFDERILLREVRPRDLAGLVALSAHLDSVNFPHDPAVLKKLIDRARDSFTGKIEDATRREYMFVMQTFPSKRIIGTCTVFAQHGHPDSPHVYFDVLENERYSITLERHFRHVILRLGFSFQGPSEIGALVLDPEHRSFGLGKPLSFVRFLFMAMYRRAFRDSVIAELMPPLLADGRSQLWEHLGRRFTGLGYQEADKLSHTNKEFIISLFPEMIQASLLPDEVQALIGQVGPETEAVRRMLEAIGFEYSYRIDPFDGGPHFEAEVDDLTVVKAAKPLTVDRARLTAEDEAAVLGRAGRDDLRNLVAVGEPEPPHKFRAVLAAAVVEGSRVSLTSETLRLLRTRTGQTVWTMPL